MSDLLAIGTSGLRSYRAALNAVGDNVANANTEGYARRSVRIGEAVGGGTTDPLYVRAMRFDGSRPVSVDRASDAFRTAEARGTAADAGRAETVQTWLVAGEAALGQDIGPALTAVFAEGARLAADPGSAAPRLAWLASLSEATRRINAAGSDLARVSTGIVDASTGAIVQSNASLTALAAVNRSIARQPNGTAAFATLEDQRDQLIDGLSVQLGTRATVTADGAATLYLGNQVLLDRTTVGTLGMTVDPNGRIALTRDGNPIVPATGSLSGLADAAAATAQRGVALDTLAADLARTINDWQAAGVRTDGAAGGPLLTGTTATTLALTSDDIAALAPATLTAANGNALDLARLREVSGLEASAAALVARQSTATAQARAEASRTSVRRDAAAAARDDIEGIDLDREAADLLRYQQAYQGSAKIIQVARETVDAILALFR